MLLPVPLADTPGLNAPIHDYKWDTRIMSFALLSSSTLLFNSFRTVDQAAINTLAHVGEQAELFAGISSGDILNRTRSMKECLAASAVGTAQFIPKLMWIIRDSELSLVDRGGNAITPTQWYEAVVHIILNMLKQAESAYALQGEWRCHKRGTQAT